MRSLAITVVLAAIVLLTSPALAGPPLLCHPLDVAGHDTLPFGEGRFETHASYPIDSAIPDTLARLAPDTPVIVRIETLRRAAIYLKDDAARRGRLLRLLQQRILDAEARNEPDALAWFDAGYLVQVYDQYGVVSHDLRDCGAASGVAGYGWVCKAMTLRGDDGQMELGAALMTLMARTPIAAGHLQRARAASHGDALLARNLDRLAPVFQELRAGSATQRG